MSSDKKHAEIIIREKRLLQDALAAERVKQQARFEGESARQQILQLVQYSKKPFGAEMHPHCRTKHVRSKAVVVSLAPLVMVAFAVAVLTLKLPTRTKNVQSPVQADQVFNQVQDDLLNSTEQAITNESVFIDGVVFPESSLRYLTEDEISSISGTPEYTRKEIIQFAINELYARHHMSFTSSYWIEYYNACSWYYDGGLSAEEAIIYFNTFELNNLNLLISARNAE